MSCHVPFRCSRGRLVVLSALLLAAVASEARADLIITPHFDGTVPVAAQTAFDYAISEFESRFHNNMTVNVDVGFGNTGLGQSSASAVGFFTYAQIKAALIAEALANPSDSIKQTVVANLPASNPAPTNNYAMSTAEAKALGLSYGAGSAASPGGSRTRLRRTRHWPAARRWSRSAGTASGST